MWYDTRRLVYITILAYFYSYPNKKAYCLLRAFFVQLRATSCQMLGTSCQTSCQLKARTRTSCQFVQNIGHFVPNDLPTKCTNLNIVPIRAKHWTLRAKNRDTQRHKLEHRANSCKTLDTSCNSEVCANFIAEKAKLC